MQIVERMIFDNGGYQVRVGKDKVFVDICKDGKYFSKEKSVVEFYAWKLKKHCNELNNEIKEFMEVIK